MTHGPCILDADRECFKSEEVKKALERMKNGKAFDLSHIYAEILKCLPQEGLAYVKDILNQAYRYGFPLDWQDNCIKAPHKGGDKNELSNYRTIMLGPIMAKLFQSLLEGQMSLWAEKNNKRAKRQAGFRAHHSTIDHLVTLRVRIEESRRQGKPLIVRMQQIGAPQHLQQGIQKLYEQVS